MALKSLFGGKASPADNNSQSSNEKVAFEKEKGYDAEAQGGILPTSTDADSDASITIGRQIELEANNAIKYRTCSWPKTAALLFSEYICLAIMSFPWSYSILGLVPGLILTFVIAGLVLYTSLTTWYAHSTSHPQTPYLHDLGNSACAIPRFAMSVTLVRCSSGTRNGPFTPQQSCLS